MIRAHCSGVPFAADDQVMLLGGGSPFLAVVDRWPSPFGKNGPELPAHVQDEVVNAAQVIVGREAPSFKGAQQMLAPCSDYLEVADRVERLVSHRSL